MKRETLISYAVKYHGEYKDILQAMKENEKEDTFSDVNAITILDEEYPRGLLDLKYPPLVLFYKGDLKLLKLPSIGIVGSRIPCDYATKATERLVKANKDKVVISGLAKGIDATAQTSALQTIGILGCGIDYIYPYSNYDLIHRVEKKGLILSEYPSLTPPLAYHFPFRNRIIAALSQKVYIMQSSKKSGTMTTVNEALELGREVHVLPYNVFEKEGENNNLLIYEGATPIKSDELVF